MSKFYQKTPFAVVSVTAMGLFTGCQDANEAPPSMPASAVTIQQVNSLEPSPASSQIIGIYRPIFIANLARAEEGIEKLANEQANAQSSTASTSQTVSRISATASTLKDTKTDNVASVASASQGEETDMSLLLQEDIKPKPTSSSDATVLTASNPFPSSTASGNLSPMATIDSDKAGIRYDTAMNALYTDSPLTTEVYDTLVDIAVFVPDVFADSEINRRLQYHSPALARMVNQHQVWKQLEITRQKQSVQLQKDQEAKFNKQLQAFNKTLEEYDKKIADYQVRLSESDKKNPENKAKAEAAARYEKKASEKNK